MSAASVPVQQANRLVDRFGREHTYLRISVTDRCNLRCTYCMPAEGIAWRARQELLSFEEIERIARVLVNMGITKIRLTGGEPMVRQNLDSLIEGLSGLDGLQTLAMTTNGVFLKNHAKRLKEAGLQALNISLDTLRRDRFLQVAQRDQLPEVLAGIESALENDFTPVKINAVIMKGVNDDEILDFITFIKDKPVNMRFIEYMPFRDNGWGQGDVFSYAEMKRVIESQYELLPIHTEQGAVAKDFSLVGHPGTVSFITSMTDSFCGTCNRLRLTADGQIKSCLFHAAEINLRDALRSGITDAELEALVTEAVLQKQEAHPPIEDLLSVKNRAMIEIGG